MSAATMTKTRKKSLCMALSLLFVGAIARGWPEIVPWGASVQPYLLASVPGPKFTSTDGKREVQLFFNDAGAMHSGNHWTWVVENHWLTGPRVIDEGYLGPEHRQGSKPIPLIWTDANEVQIQYYPSH